MDSWAVEASSRAMIDRKYRSRRSCWVHISARVPVIQTAIFVVLLSSSKQDHEASRPRPPPSMSSPVQVSLLLQFRGLLSELLTASPCERPMYRTYRKGTVKGKDKGVPLHTMEV